MSKPYEPVLSKTKYLHGLQCPKLQWVEFNARELLPPVDEALKFRFQQGHEVGEVAQRVFPGGRLIEWDVGFREVLRLSQQALAARQPLFEPAFLHGRAFTRADVLLPVGESAWDIMEVKSSTEPRELYLEDLAFQRFVYQGAGLQIRRCKLMLLDRTYVRQGEVEPERLFHLVDCTEEIEPLLARVGARVEEMQRNIARPSCPQVEVGAQCSTPYSCPLTDHCWSFLPRRSVFTLYRGGDRAMELMGQGVLRLKDVPDDVPLTANHQVQRRAVRQGRVQVQRRALRGFLEQLRYPLYLLDFETAATPIPLWDGVRPYQQVPFQFSLHAVERPGAEAQHHAFLPCSSDDPRPRLLQQLGERLGEQGSILVYYAPFERGRLQECARDLPEHAEWIERVLERIVDLRDPFSQFWVYHPKQEGSTSLKEVMPALTGRGYDELEVADGMTAARRYLDMTFGGLDEGERQRMRQQLLDYCGRDTEGMIWILERLERLAR